MNESLTIKMRSSYVFEGMSLVGEGVDAECVERVPIEAGMSIGPLALLDLTSLEAADEALHLELSKLETDTVQGSHSHIDSNAQADSHSHSHSHSHNVKSKRIPESAVYVLEKMAHGFGRMGKAEGAGFYDYDSDGTSELWAGLSAFRRSARNIPTDDIRDRLLYVQALEGIRCIEDGSAPTSDDSRAAEIPLWGFMTDFESVVRFVNKVGLANFVERARELAARYGERFEPPSSLGERAQQGESL